MAIQLAWVIVIA